MMAPALAQAKEGQDRQDDYDKSYQINDAMHDVASGAGPSTGDPETGFRPKGSAAGLC
jgi:hypothetical protein